MHPALQSTLAAVDPEIAELIAAEERRQRDKIRLIASENYVSGAVLAATGSVLTNKYSEGYPGKRYYEGQQYIDRAKALDAAGMELNYNSIPFDPRKPFDPSGVRLGTPAVTSRGMKEAEMKQIAAWMDAAVSAPSDAGLHEKIAGEIRELCAKFPAPGILVD